MTLTHLKHLPKDRQKYWLVDNLRLSRPMAAGVRFSLEVSKNPLREYYKGPLSKRQAVAAKKYLSKVWGGSCE